MTLTECRDRLIPLLRARYTTPLVEQALAEFETSIRDEATAAFAGLRVRRAEFEGADGELRLEISEGFREALSFALIGMFRGAGAVNWLEWQVQTDDPEFGPVRITAQRVQGETPGEKIRRLEAEVRELRGETR